MNSLILQIVNLESLEFTIFFLFLYFAISLTIKYLVQYLQNKL